MHVFFSSYRIDGIKYIIATLKLVADMGTPNVRGTQIVQYRGEVGAFHTPYGMHVVSS